MASKSSSIFLVELNLLQSKSMGVKFPPWRDKQIWHLEGKPFVICSGEGWRLNVDLWYQIMVFPFSTYKVSQFLKKLIFHFLVVSLMNDLMELIKRTL